MWMLVLAASVAALPQQPAEKAPQPPELAVVSARLGDCSADFTVKDPAGQPVYTALVQVRVRYGFLGVKRMDLEVGTGPDGRARIEGLPAGARLLTYDISKGDLTAAVEQDPSRTCTAKFDVSLEERAAQVDAR